VTSHLPYEIHPNGVPKTELGSVFLLFLNNDLTLRLMTSSHVSDPINEAERSTGAERQ